jgi:hypothetical protein
MCSLGEIQQKTKANPRISEWALGRTKINELEWAPSRRVYVASKGQLGN